MLKVIGIGLVIVHLFLWFWSVGGVLELFLSKVPWKPYSNHEFPQWLLIIHWTTVLFASSIFLYGYTTHWDRTPDLMAVGYGLMAVVCIIETFGFMTSKTKFLAMALEYVAYTLILILLYSHSFQSQHFK